MMPPSKQRTHLTPTRKNLPNTNSPIAVEGQLNPWNACNVTVLQALNTKSTSLFLVADQHQRKKDTQVRQTQEQEAIQGDGNRPKQIQGIREDS